MNDDTGIEWYKKIAIAAGAIVFSPLLIVAVGAAAAVDAAKEPGRRKEYGASKFFESFHLPYTKGITFSDEYNFYNEAVAKGIDFELVRTPDFSYIVADGGVYLLPWFDGISYSDPEQRWLVEISGDPSLLSDDFSYEISRLRDEHKALPIHVLVREENLMYRNELSGMSTSEDDARGLLPEYITLCTDYVSALENKEQ